MSKLSVKANIRIVKYDLREGIINRLPWYIPVLFLACISAVITANQANVFFEFKGLNIAPSFADYLIVFTRGSLPYSIETNKPFELPALWISNHIYILFLTSYYPKTQLRGYGSQVLMKLTHRSYWWKSKCLYVLTSTLSCFVIQFGVLFLFALKSASIFTPTVVLLTELFHVPPAVFAQGIYSLYAIVLPILLSCALALCQMVLSLITNSSYSYILMVFYLGVSAYIYSPYLIGNASMLLRSSLSICGGVEFASMSVILVIICISAAIIGESLFCNYDILQK